MEQQTVSLNRLLLICAPEAEPIDISGDASLQLSQSGFNSISQLVKWVNNKNGFGRTLVEFPPADKETLGGYLVAELLNNMNIFVKTREEYNLLEALFTNDSYVHKFSYRPQYDTIVIIAGPLAIHHIVEILCKTTNTPSPLEVGSETITHGSAFLADSDSAGKWSVEYNSNFEH